PQVEAAQQLPGHERGCDRLGVAGSRHRVAYRVQPAVLAGGGGMPGRPAGAGQGRRHPVVSVDATDLLGHVLRNGDVEAEDGWKDVPCAVALDADLET